VKIESIKEENDSSFEWKHLVILIGFVTIVILFLAAFQASSSSSDLEDYDDPYIDESEALNESSVGGNDTKENDSSKALINSTEEPVMEENNSSSDAELYINTSSSDVIQ